jgi:uncharacterized protein YjbI with pentapeptide repeats
MRHDLPAIAAAHHGFCPVILSFSSIRKKPAARRAARTVTELADRRRLAATCQIFMCYLHKLPGAIWSNGATAIQALTRRVFMMKMLSRLAALFALVIAFGGSSVAVAFDESDLQNLKKLNACEGCDLSAATLKRVDLWGANMKGANLQGADLTDSILRAANLSGANLSGATLRDVKLMVADLSEADLSGADLSGVDLWNSNLEKANLSGANLSKANLLEANLSGADLSGANLIGAKMRGVDLSGANLSGADLTDAIIPNANMQGAILCKTMLPSGEDNSGC